MTATTVESKPFFSIVIPAHNEEKYIVATIQSLLLLAYPPQQFEVIVVENGSSDKTLEVASRFASSRVRVVVAPRKGVALARSFGTSLVSPNSTWILFLDADTMLDTGFLRELVTFLGAHTTESYVAGSFAVQPDSSILAVQSLFLWSNFWRSFSKVPSAAFCITTDVMCRLPPPDETREVGEDVALFEQARVHGSAFFFATNGIHTSVRRFEKKGWLRMILYWLIVMPLPGSLQRKLHYHVVR